MKHLILLLLSMALSVNLHAQDAVPSATVPNSLDAAGAYLQSEPTERIFYNAKGKRVGQLYANGYIFDELGTYVGVLKDQRVLYDTDGKLLGEMDANGFIYNRSGEFVGELTSTPLPGKDVKKDGAPGL
jgi:hypothetical protein